MQQLASGGTGRALRHAPFTARCPVLSGGVRRGECSRSSRRAALVVRASTHDTTSTPSDTATHAAAPTPSSGSGSGGSESSQDVKIKRTLAGLDALLGIQPEEEAKPSGGSKATAVRDAPAQASASADPSRPSSSSSASTSGSGSSAGGSSNSSGGPMDDQFQKIIDKARQLADAQNSNKQSNVEAQQQQLRQEFETLLQAMSKSNELLSKEDLKRLREAAFGPQTFWVTEVLTLQEMDKTGVLIRGNLRDERVKVFDTVRAKVAELFGAGKFEVIMIEDEQQAAEPTDGPAARGPVNTGGAGATGTARYGPRVAFQIVPAAQALPPQTNGWKQGAAFVLFLLFGASSLQLSLVANITKLPKETLAFFANPDNFSSDVLPPGLEDWDPTSYFVTAVPIFVALLGTNFFHEIGHRLAASIRGVRLGPSYFVPNLQLGSFGAITPFASLLKDRSTMWDVSAAGPLAGMLASLAVLLLGLSQSAPGLLPAELLVPVPTTLFRSSLLLGTVVKVVLGDQVGTGAEEVLISPLVIAGWCSLVTNALNLLPVGSLDGGRLMQAAYGRQALALSSFFTYVGLGLGFLGSSLSLPFGLYVIICQRTAERYIQVRPHMCVGGGEEGRAHREGNAGCMWACNGTNVAEEQLWMQPAGGAWRAVVRMRLVCVGVVCACVCAWDLSSGGGSCTAHPLACASRAALTSLALRLFTFPPLAACLPAPTRTTSLPPATPSARPRRPLSWPLSSSWCRWRPRWPSRLAWARAWTTSSDASTFRAQQLTGGLSTWLAGRGRWCMPAAAAAAVCCQVLLVFCRTDTAAPGANTVHACGATAASSVGVGGVDLWLPHGCRDVVKGGTACT